MRLVAVYVDKNKDKIGQIAGDFVKGLTSHGVPVVETSNGGLNITTPHCYITFVSELDKLRGRKFDVIFGNVPELFKITRLKNNGHARFKGDVLEYVLIEELWEHRE